MRKRLKEERIRHKLSVEDIADSLGISESFYYKIESGIRNPTIDLAKKIAKIFNLNVDDLFFNPEMD